MSTASNVAAALIVATGLAAIFNMYIGSFLTFDGPDIGDLGSVTKHAHEIRFQHNNELVRNDDIVACVGVESGNSCMMYPCIKRNGTFIRLDKKQVEHVQFGYSGRFVHREQNLTRAVMHQSGSTGWASGCVVSDKYKFVYIHVLKSGGTATKEFIRKSLCGEEDKDCKHVDPWIVRPSMCRQAVEKNRDYFFFSFVRNPFSRMFSMYSMMDGFPPPRQMSNNKASDKQLTHGVFNSHFKRGRNHRRLSVTDEFSFHDFVLHPDQRRMHTTMSPSHYGQQLFHIFSNSKTRCPSFDFLGRVEHYDEDMRKILFYLNATDMIAYLDKQGGEVKPANTWGTNKKKTLSGGLIAAYNDSGVIDAVIANYRDDFDLLGYSAYEIPAK